MNTPRTDEAELDWPHIVRELPFAVVRVEHARQLEAELAEMRQAMSRVATNIGNGSFATADASHEWMTKEVPQEVLHYCNRLRRELAEVTKERDAVEQEKAELISQGLALAADRNDCAKERDELKSTLSDPVAVRVNLLRGTIAKPIDMHFEHDEHGLIAGLKAKLEKCRAAISATLDKVTNATEYARAHGILSEALDETK